MIAKVLNSHNMIEDLDSDLLGADVAANQKSKLIVYDKKIKVEVIGEDFEVRISKLTGNITSLIFYNVEYLVEPVKVIFDSNEVTEDISDENMDKILFSIIRDLRKGDDHFKVEDVFIDNNGDEIVIMVTRKVRSVKNGLITQYIIDMYGNVTITNILTPRRDIYRFGTTMTLKKGVDYIQWITKGLKNKKNDERCKLIGGNFNETIPKESKTKFKIKARKTNVKQFKVTDKSGVGLLIEGNSGQSLSIRANHSVVKEELYNLKDYRLKNSVIINIDYREKRHSNDLFGENYEEEYKLKKNIQYVCSYKISSTL